MKREAHLAKKIKYYPDEIAEETAKKQHWASHHSEVVATLHMAGRVNSEHDN